MKDFLKIGDFYPMDALGRVLNRADSRHLKGEWKALAEAVVAAFRSEHGERLLGVYVRGSVVAGSAVAGVSDLDSFALLAWEEGEKWFRWEERAWSRGICEDLQARFPVASKVEMAECSWRGNGFADNPRLRDMVATQALCIWGMDVLPQLSPPRLADLKRNGRWIETDWREFLAAEGEGARTNAGRTFVKTLIRGIFEEMMEREGKYATDFHPCIQVIAKYKPEWEARLRELVEIFSAPEGKLEKLENVGNSLLDDFFKGEKRL